MGQTEFQGKTCAVLGLARSGVPAARFLVEQGAASVTGYDDKPRDQLGPEALALEEIGVRLLLRDHGYSGLDQCDVIILSPGLKIHHDPLCSVIARCEAVGAEVIGELELASRYCPAPIIAVTGTKGKSTTVKLITELLQAAGCDALRAGNTGVPLIAELPNLSPQSFAVVEVSSFQLERAPTFAPRVAVLLNLLEDHQDYHTSLEQYWSTKLKLFANQTEVDIAVLNLDDPGVRGIVSQESFEIAGPRCVAVTAGSRADSDASAEVAVSIEADELGLWSDDDFSPVIRIDEIPLNGRHNLANVAAAVAAVRAALGSGEKHRNALAAAIREFESLPHRLEVVATKGGITWVNDSQATIPEAAARALASFEPPVTLIAGGRAKLEPASYDVLGQAIALHAHRLLTIGEAAEMVAAAALKAGYLPDKVLHAGNLTNAVKKAKILTPGGGTVVLSPACASFDQFSSYEARGEAFRNAVASLGEGEDEAS